MRKRQPREAMLDVLEFDGKRVADVGCGDGSGARIMAQRGAVVTPIAGATLPTQKTRTDDHTYHPIVIEGTG